MIGAEVDLAAIDSGNHGRLDALIFGETSGRVIITTTELDSVKAVERAKLMGVPAQHIGTVGGEALKIKIQDDKHTWEVAGLHDLWWNAIDNAMA